MGKYLPTALGNLEFAWQLLALAKDGDLDFSNLNNERTWGEGNLQFSFPKIPLKPDDILIALENNCLIAFGVAAITLNTSREEQGLGLPNSTIETESDQFISITYQIRNAFAHDLPEPKWNLRQEQYIRKYEFGGVCIDISDVKHGDPLSYIELGGPEILYKMSEYLDKLTS